MGSYYYGIACNSYKNRYLKHHGIVGQKWGVRRFQNLDGTLTKAGKERYLKSTEVSSGNANQKSNNSANENIKINHDVNSKEDAVTFVASLAATPILAALATIAPIDPYNKALMYTTAVSSGILAATMGTGAISSAIKSKKYEKERNENPVDKKTGFHLKTKELSEKEDIKRVNPEVNDFNSNTKQNCVLCTMTTEMRKRGYDVTAKKAGMGYYDWELNKFFPKIKMEPVATREKSERGSGYAKRVVESIEKKQPEGSRGDMSIMYVSYDDGINKFYSGHSVFYEIKNNKLTIKDGQIGRIYSDPEDVKSLFENAADVSIARFDNLKFDINGIKEACR